MKAQRGAYYVQIRDDAGCSGPWNIDLFLSLPLSQKRKRQAEKIERIIFLLYTAGMPACGMGVEEGDTKC